MSGIIDYDNTGWHSYRTYGDDTSYTKCIQTKSYNAETGILTWYLTVSYRIKDTTLTTATVSVKPCLIM